MQLPPRKSGEPLNLIPNARQLTIIGANGSGKTRFTEWLERSLKGKAYRLSVM